jgi:hypothetical protein
MGMAAVTAGCGEQEMSPAEKKSEIEAVQAHYRRMDIGGGFNVSRIKAKGQNIVGQLGMSSSEQECSFQRTGTEQLRIVVSLACPYADDPVWSQIKSTHDIKLELSCRGKVMYVHSCRNGQRKGTSY